ncbi:hypothetical protein AAFF_G00204430 [Aldrovandia affinis]|uniref:Fibronectin type-III domain-containing protein n=1 Tax=Aldrovandia affinis TaxID=143900 RepID=A0AAD7RI09_9TELE|nr:hypothetical protein AAFF_G00204430 [Aldrovandia affinis]
MGSVNSLLPNTVYIVEVEAIDIALNVLSSAEVEEITAPDVPTIEQAYSKQSDSITVEFSAKTGASSYVLRAESVTREFFSETPVSASPGTVLHLQPYTNYILSVMSVNSGGMSQPSLPVEVKTVVAAPKLNSTALSNSTILLTWDRVEDTVLYTLCIIMEGSDTRVKLNTTDTSVAFNDLEPGTTYCIKGNAWDPHSIPGDDFTVCQITCPPTPGSVQVTLTADGSHDMTVHWEAVHGADRYLALSTTGQKCTSSDTHCVISPLSCGQNHSITVTAINQAGPSGPSQPEDFLTFPCPPKSIWVEEPVPGNCTMLWSEVPWVDYYKAFVKRDDGSEELCNTTSNTCNYCCECGFTYFMNVFAYNRAGSSPPGHVLNYTTIPCCPEDVSILLVSTETLEIMWSPVRGAEVYETKAAGTSDLIHCNDTAPVCALSDLKCNTKYSVVVRPCSELRGCNNTCRPHTEETAPCTPEILGITQTNASCFNVSWSASNKEANYTVNVVGETESHTCHSTGTSCEVPTYHVALPMSLMVIQVTQAMTNVTWSAATAAESYVTSLTSPRGDAKCRTLDTHCLMGCITCGTNYTVSLEAISSKGQKSECTYHGFSSSACCPSSVKLYRMANNTIRVYWRSSGNLNNYTADLYGANSNYTCTPLPGGHSCDVSEIMCGDVYTAVVAPLSRDGMKIKFCPKRMYSALSAVTSISVDYSCSSGSVTVNWRTVFGADSYRAAAVDSSGTVLSCTSQSENCQIMGVTCGERYLVQVTAISNSCESTANATTHFETVPCPPTDLELYRECSSNVIIFSWAPTNHTSYYVATAIDSNGERTNCITVETSCLFTHTFCGRGYQFIVYSVSGASQCKSGQSSPVHIRTAPCAPKNLVTSSECYSDVLISTWNEAPGAISYLVEAWGNTKQHNRYNCSSVTNSCAIPGVHCGESLTMWIYAFDEDCNSEKALGEVAETVPCVPQNVSAVMECNSNAITMYWEYSHGAVFYIGTAVHSDGTMSTCVTTETTCRIEGLHCGQTYSAFIIASNFNCNSSASLHVSVDTAPCPPGQVEASLDCAGNYALVTWQSLMGGASYTATAEDEEGGLLSCSTFNDSCKIPELKCGKKYAVSVIYRNGRCPSMPSTSIEMDSVPCGPNNMQTHVDCGTGVLNVGWDASAHAEGYTTVVEAGNGEKTYCNSSETQCSFDTLECGLSYTVKVKSVTGSCLSMPSKEIIQEGPCVPTNVTVEHSCEESSAMMMWEASRGATSYIVTAVGEDGHAHECISDGTACILTDLHCSQVYTVAVSAVDDKCTSLQSQTITLSTVPCPPSHVEARIDCMSNTATVSWDASPNAVSYSGWAVGTDGHNVSCDSSSPDCQMAGLHCGQEYAFTVLATDGSCRSPKSTEIRKETAPCTLQNMAIHLACHSNLLMVTWDPSAFPVNYSAIARAADGTEQSCHSQLEPSCGIDNLSCGQEYSVTVTASNSHCHGPTSAAQTIETVPCVPQNVMGHMECDTNILTTSWSRSPGASTYTATLSGSGGYSEACSTSDLTCTFSSLQCAQPYTFSVVAHDLHCDSSASSTVSTATGPCDPQNVDTTLHCETNMVIVSWDASAGASRYMVLARDEEEQLSSCSTTDTSCQLNQLNCGDTYNISVLADDGICNSSSQPRVVIETAPCPPVIENHSLDCATNIASVSWGSDDNAVEFHINGTSTLGLKTSCSTTSTACELSDLECGQTYTIYGTALGQECKSGPSSGVNIVTAPCAVSMAYSSYDCATNIALVNWDDSRGRDSFYTCVEGDGHTDCCSTDETMCTFTSLQCGQHYDVNVKALASHCNSSQTSSPSINTVPCAPQNVSASLMCANNTAVVTWAATEGAVNYSVIALGRDGDNKHCHTTDTTCNLPMMHCGQTYLITVTPSSEICSGFPSKAIAYTAGPCPPNHVTVALQCDGNIGAVSWESVIGAEMYMATARGVDGHEDTCHSNSTNCSITDLHCGSTYSISVITYMRGCHSDPSPGTSFTTAICPPINLEGHTSCETSILTIMWDPSPVRNVKYFLVSQKEGGGSTTYSTTDTSLFMSGSECGESYSIRVITQDSICNSSLSLPLEQNTAPCPPTNLGAHVDCGTNRGTISWLPGRGGVIYVAEAVGAHGHRVSCSSNSTSCSMKVDCGSQYRATVISSNDVCNSTLDNTIGFDSAPCLPGNVEAMLECSSNELMVTWQQSPGMVAYTALAIATNGYRASCNTSSTACTIESLRCGQTYSIAVTTSSIDCGVIEGSDYEVISAPCEPLNPGLDLNCSNNVATVFWDHRVTQQTYSVTAVDGQGQSSICDTTGSNCTFDQLSCGETYSFSIVGWTDQCRTAASPTMELHAVPCIPTHVSASVDCDTGIASIVWDAARGAVSYLVQAQGSGGHSTSCVNTDTQCAINDMKCGQDYIIVIIVMGHDGNCNSLASEPVTVTTGPCPHTSLKASLDCSTNMAAISWVPGDGTLLYTASAESSPLGHSVSCATNGSGCDIASMQCGQRYRVSVVGMGHTCTSITGSWIAINTAPCVPTQVTVRSSCSSNVASVSWTAAQGALMYIAAAEDRYGNMVTCNTSDTACNITGLLCGRAYNVSVTAMDETCVGGKSEIHMLKTAPCVPAAVETYLVCETGDFTISWQPSEGAQRYHASVRSSDGRDLVYDADNTTCFFPTLPCGDTYSITVYAYDDACNSSLSPAVLVTTAPCPPLSVLVNVDCGTSITTVFWDSSVHGVLYTVLATDANGDSSTCTTADTNCALTTLRCGTLYNMTVSGSRDGCMGALTSQQTFRTAPCVPVLIEVEMDCLSDSAWVVWEESVGAEMYTASAVDDTDRVYQCGAADNTCTVPDLQCGQHYTFTVTALDRQCTSVPSNAIDSESAPCPPQNVQATVGCDNRTASISWAVSYLALTYTATLERTDGETSCCTTDGTSCDIADLPCGEMYVLTVAAEGHTCNSSQSQGSIIRTASLNCANNVARASWNHSKGGQVYLVQASGSDGHSASCNSYKTSCSIATLHCGQTYNLTVVAQDSSCTSAESQPAMVKTVPCITQNVSTDINCELNSMSISWEETDGADSYTATLQDSDGRSTTCNTLGTNSCDVTGLNCGKVYHVTVQASDGYCTSSPSLVTDSHSVPCMAGHIAALMDCETQTALVSWYFSAGALSYSVTMETVSGHALTCMTEDTNCEMSGLACGERYSVSVLAKGEICSKIARMAGQLLTQPCLPLNVHVEYSQSIGQLIWDRSKGATSYSAEAITSQGLTSTCNTDETACVLHDLECSQVYNITVSAHNQACRDVATSQAIALTTEPCPPAHVEAQFNCETGMASVSWEQSYIAVGYAAFLEGRNGHSSSCITTETSCSVDDLLCGTVYYVRVRALGNVLSSEDSISITLTTAPCVPEDVDVQFDCETDTAVVTWSWSEGAESYTASVMEADGYVSSCSTDENFCNITDLGCGQTYNLSLTSINEQCEILSLTGITFHTRPCTPLHLNVDLQCGTNTATLSWTERDEVELYAAQAMTSSGAYAVSCNSTGSTCVFSNLHCGETYRFTVTAYSSQCQSELSDTVEVITAPCQPGVMTTHGSCSSDTVSLVWEETRGAYVYIVTAVGDLGYITAFNTTDTSLTVSLPCGQIYSLSLVAQDDRCDSPSSMTAEYRTAPCVPRHVTGYGECEDSVGSVSWARSDGAESYTAVAVGEDDDDTHMCNTDSTSCTWTDLHCGEVYTVHVIANNGYMCSSEPSNSTIINMAPCVPQNLVSTLNCDQKVVSLSWEASKGADVYLVIAESGSGHKVEFSSHITSAHISALECGQVYFLTVTAVGLTCTSAPSSALSLQTEPCAPTDVTSQLDCVTNILLVSWAAAEGAEFYTAKVETEDGQSAICMSSDLQCGIANLICGQNYTASITASRPQCHSTPSESSSLRSAPCVPQNVSTVMDCADNTALVSWSYSLGAKSYEAIAQGNGQNQITCETTTLNCVLTGLTCGTTYTVWVVAIEGNCVTLLSEPVLLQSVPCTPEIGDVHLDCFTNSVLMDWGYVAGGRFYEAMAETSSGGISVCKTNHTNCEIVDLECGQVYTVTMVACDGQCNSSLSAGREVTSVPCAPQNVESRLDCATDSAHVTWESASGAEHYLVHAIGVEGHVAECSTTELECWVPDLMCSYIYNMSVVAIDQQCNVSESDVTQMASVPCVPQHVEARVDCETDEVSVSWEESYGATAYTAIAQGDGGYSYSCSTSGTVCQFSELLCGMSYSIEVSAADDACSSPLSSAVRVNTVPCEPQNVSAVVDCSSNTGVVTWEYGEGVLLYLVEAAGPDGHRTQCISLSTSCQLPDLHCGQKYNLTVTAQNGICESKAYLSLQSVSCEPHNVQATFKCISNSVSVTWERASGALYYDAVGKTTDEPMAHCSSNDTHCDLGQLPCGQTYDVSVSSVDESCTSVESLVVQVDTAPCPPMHVIAIINCRTNIMMVTWDSNDPRDTYRVTAAGTDNNVYHCNTSDTSCSITHLPCGQTFMVQVVAIRDGCESDPSQAVPVNSVSCKAQRVSGNLDCVTNSAWITWEPAMGAETYTVTALGGNKYNASCSTKQSPCNVPDLRCGVIYTFHVITANSHCESEPSDSFEMGTAPCALTTITAFTQCHSSIIQVMWELTEGSPLYIATAEGNDRSALTCNSTSTSCELTGAQCDIQYTIIVAASSDKCSSLRSPPHKIKTAPCAPHDVSLSMDCGVEGVAVSWAPSFIAESYQVTAQGRDGDLKTCDTTLTNCTVPALHCGQPYSFTVTASAHNCTSPASSGLTYNTVPCDPHNIQVQHQCASNSALLSWDRSAGSVKYFAWAHGNNGDTMHCASTGTSCTIEGLQCGAMYNFSVLSSDGICNGSLSEPILHGAVPCAPDGLKIRLLPMESDGNQVVRVSWNFVLCPLVEYLVEMAGRIWRDMLWMEYLVDVASYWTARPFFEIPLPCSSSYNVTLRSKNTAGIGPVSETISGTTAPCPPPSVTYNGDINYAVIAWNASGLATDFTVYKRSSTGRIEVCSTPMLFCQVTNVTLAAIEVTASNSAGESYPAVIPIPIPPDSIHGKR